MNVNTYSKLKTVGVSINIPSTINPKENMPWVGQALLAIARSDLLNPQKQEQPLSASIVLKESLRVIARTIVTLIFPVLIGLCSVVYQLINLPFKIQEILFDPNSSKEIKILKLKLYGAALRADFTFLVGSVALIILAPLASISSNTYAKGVTNYFKLFWNQDSMTNEIERELKGRATINTYAPQLGVNFGVRKAGAVKKSVVKKKPLADTSHPISLIKVQL